MGRVRYLFYLMNVYDFDKTIYKGDSSVDFYWFCLKKHPQILRCVPRQLAGFALYACKRISKTKMKETFFSFLKKLPDVEQDTAAFWKTHCEKICPWYVERYDPQDVVISASPAFLLEEICVYLGVTRLIASDVDCKTGLFRGKNCRGEEKVKRFLQAFPKESIDEFFSDSVSDAPLARLAKCAYIVKDGRISPWPSEK